MYIYIYIIKTKSRAIAAWGTKNKIYLLIISFENTFHEFVL